MAHPAEARDNDACSPLLHDEPQCPVAVIINADNAGERADVACRGERMPMSTHRRERWIPAAHAIDEQSRRPRGHPLERTRKGLAKGGALALAMTAVSGLGLSAAAWAFKLSPEGTVIEIKVAKKNLDWWRRTASSLSTVGLEHFTEPVHEEITNRMYDCDGDADVCGDPDSGYASPYVLAGVRWNDDPPFRQEPGDGTAKSCRPETIRFTTQPKCWYDLFKDAGRYARDAASESDEEQWRNRITRLSLLGRSHFGDLQFIHSMASRDGERAEATRKRILMWAEFTWGVVTKKYTLGTPMREIDIEGMSDHFAMKGWTVQDLFALGNPPLRRRIDEVAFGSLLHMVQDSFAMGHVDRRPAVNGASCDGVPRYAMPGRIRSFHAYANQDAGAHAHYDTRDAFSSHWTEESPDVIDVGKVLISYFESRAPWSEVEPYVSCLYVLEDPDAPANAGDAFVDR